MRRTYSALSFLVGAAALAFVSAPALAGEVNGSATNPKVDFSQGASICKFSGLNDKPLSQDPEDPGGRTQSYGQLVRHDWIDPHFFNPGDACNPNLGGGEPATAPR